MLLKGIIWEDFVNYKIPSTTLMFPSCTFKCGENICQNSPISNEPNIEVNIDEIIKKYLDNPIPKAFVFQGLEPFDSFMDVYLFLLKLRREWNCNDDAVIYTGYTEDEIKNEIQLIKKFENVIVKFGRYIPNQDSHYDQVLGVNLASNNQYAKRI